MDALTDDALILAWQTGDVAAFSLLYERYRDRVFGFAFRMLAGDRHAAEDALQDVFTKVSEAARYYRPRDSFASWVFTIARNRCLNVLRSRGWREAARAVPLTGDGADPGAAGAPAIAPDDVALTVERRDLAGQIEWAVGTLPPHFREVFLLHAVDGFSHEETARILCLPPATVRSWYHRARSLLRKRVGPLLSEGSHRPEVTR